MCIRIDESRVSLRLNKIQPGYYKSKLTLGLMVGVIISIFFGVSVSSKLSIGFEGRGFFRGEIPTDGPLSAEYSRTDGLPLYDGELLSSIGSSPSQI